LKVSSSKEASSSKEVSSSNKKIKIPDIEKYLPNRSKSKLL